MLGLSPLWNAALHAGGDPVLSAGGIYLLNLASRYTRPGLSFARAQEVYGVQGDGSLTAYTGSQVPWEAQGVRLDPSWTNSFCNRSIGGGLTLGTGLMNGLSGRPLNKGTIPSGTFNYAQVGGANTLTFTASQGQSVDLSFQGYVGAPTGPMALGLNVVNALTTGLSANSAYNGFKISATGAVFGKFLAGGVTELQAPLVEQVAPGLWKFSWLLRYTQGATIRDNTRMYLEVLDPSGSAANVAGDGVSAVHWELCQHALASYHPPIADTTTAPASVPSFSFAGLTADMGITLGGEYGLGVEYTSAVTAADKVVCGMSSGAFANSIYFIPRNASAQQSCSMISGNVPQLESMSTASAAVGVKQRVLLRAKLNDSRAGFNGGLAPLDSACAMPVGLTNITVGKAPWGGNANDFAGWVSKLFLFPINGPNDAQLQALSAIT